jgi:aminopeptidase N
MGDDAFFGAMRAWVAEHRHGFAAGRRLLAHLQRRTDADLVPIYRRYLQDVRLPPRGPRHGGVHPARPE